jgi:hypothetical protein
LLFGALLLASAQEPAAAKTSSIAGTVVKEPGSEPLKKVLVQVVAEDRSWAEATPPHRRRRPFPRRQCCARALPHLRRENRIRRSQPARASNLTSTCFTVQAGQSLEDLLFRMLPTAVISGRVTDEDGDPMSGSEWSCKGKSPVRRGAKRVGTGHERSGRIPSCRAISRPVLDCGHAAARHPRLRTAQPEIAWARTWKTAQAKPSLTPAISPPTIRALTMPCRPHPSLLKAGDEMPVNFTLVPARTYRVRGVVLASRPPRSRAWSWFPRRAMLTARTRMKSGRTASSKSVESRRAPTFCGHRPEPERSRSPRVRRSTSWPPTWTASS